MQFTKPFKEAITRGEITISFRNWQQPRAKVGGEYNIHPFGAIRVLAMCETTIAKAPRTTIQRAGFAGKDDLAAYLKCEATTPVHRVEFTYLGPKNVKVPARGKLSDSELTKLIARLNKIEWAASTLVLLRDNPHTRAGDLADLCGMQRDLFKRNVRRLKGLGLTISHDAGYELSTRGTQMVASLDKNT